MIICLLGHVTVVELLKVINMTEIKQLLDEIDKSELLLSGSRKWVKSLVKLAYTTGRVDASKEIAENMEEMFTKYEN